MNSFLSLSSHNKNFFLLLCTSADGRHGSFICQKIIIGLVITMAEISNPTPTQNPGRPGFLALVTIILAVLFSMKNSPLSLAGQSYQKVWSFFLFFAPFIYQVTFISDRHGFFFLSSSSKVGSQLTCLILYSCFQINFLHRFVGRIVFILVTIHGGLFLKMYLAGIVKDTYAMYVGGAMWAGM